MNCNAGRGPRPALRLFPMSALAAQAPLLVGAAVAGPENDLRAVGGAGTVGVQAQPGLFTRDSAVGVDVPLLVGLAVAVPDHHGGAVAGSPAVGVQAFAAVHL